MSLKKRSFNRGSIACIYSAWLLVVKYDGTAQVQPQKNHALGEKSKGNDAKLGERKGRFVVLIVCHIAR